MTINLLQPTPSGQPVTVTVSRNLDAASGAISDFVKAYNTVVDDLSKQVGKDAGALSGQSIVGTLRGALRQINQYSAGSGSVSSLTRVGLSLDSAGKLSFKASVFNADGVDALQAFLGGADAGGFLKAANDALNTVEDTSVGSLKMEEKLVGDEITRQNALIDQSTQKLNDLQDTLNQQMAAADAAIASLENQKNYFTNLFTAMINNNSSGVKAT